MSPGITHRRRLPAGILLLSTVLGGSAPQALRAGQEVGADVEAALAAGNGSYEHETWNGLVVRAVRGGGVDYRYLQEHRTELDRYLDGVARADLSLLSREELMAFLINAYNALTVRSILEHSEVASIRDIDGVWDERTHVVGGHRLTLDAIEHQILRPYFKDPRIHFAVNCASRSCAPLAPVAYQGSVIEAQLEAQTRAFLQDPAQIRVENGELLLSRYFDWYGGDFTESDWSPRADSIVAFVTIYGSDEVKEFVARAGGDPSVEFLDYDWSLNTTDSSQPR